MITHVSGFLILLLFLSVSCKNSNVGEIKSNRVKWGGRKIGFPNELMLLEGKDIWPNEKFDSLLGEHYIVVSIVDVSCTSCIVSQLNRTDSLFQSLLGSEDKIVFILNVERSDSASFMVSVQPYIKAKGYILWDSNFYFESLNDVFTSNISDRTFLLDFQREIVLVGNPLFQPDLISEYRNILSNQGK